MTTQILIRMPDKLLATVDEAVRQANTNRTAFVLNAVRAAVGDEAEPPVVLGWIAIDIPGERGVGWQCPECGQDMISPHVGIMSNGVLTTVVCEICIT